MSQKGNKTYIDGNLIKDCVTQNFEKGKLTLGGTEMNFYGMTVTENGKVSHDLTPVLDASGKSCIKDQVTGKFYYVEADINYVK